MNKRILQLAVPNIISNITVPLLGLVDMAIVGHMGDKAYIEAVAIGAAMFNLLYWNFGFLRMGTSGLAAQSYGQRNFSDSILILARATGVSITLALLLIALQSPLSRIGFQIIAGKGNPILPLAYSYFSILIWAAPATLGLYAFKGWFIGMQNSKTPMVIAIVVNVLNIIFSLFFVLVLKMKIEGVAWGSLLAQYGGLLLAYAFFHLNYQKLLKKLKYSAIWQLKEMLNFFKINADIFLRTLCLTTVFTFFTSASARMSTDTLPLLAVNALLMQLFTLFSYIMDGFAYAGEALVGRFVGAKNLPLLKQTIRTLLGWGFALSLLFTLLYFIWGENILALITNEKKVLQAASSYFYWVIPIPIVGFSAFLWDGIFIGASASKNMRNAMFIATGVFFTCFFLLHPYWGVNALWCAFHLFLGLRGVLQHIQVNPAVYAKAVK